MPDMDFFWRALTTEDSEHLGGVYTGNITAPLLPAGPDIWDLTAGGRFSMDAFVQLLLLVQ